MLLKPSSNGFFSFIFWLVPMDGCYITENVFSHFGKKKNIINGREKRTNENLNKGENGDKKGVDGV